MFEILDIGCGHRPKGDINVDLFINATKHRSDNQNICDDKPLKVKSIPNFIKCDAHYLPFRDKTFFKVFCGDVLEHLINPSLALDDMIRVCKREIVIVVPYYLFDNKKVKVLHINSFNVRWFLRFSEGKGLSCSCHFSGFIRFIKFIPIYVPAQITCKLVIKSCGKNNLKG